MREGLDFLTLAEIRIAKQTVKSDLLGKFLSKSMLRIAHIPHTQRFRKQFPRTNFVEKAIRD